MDFSTLKYSTDSADASNSSPISKYKWVKMDEEETSEDATDFESSFYSSLDAKRVKIDEEAQVCDGANNWTSGRLHPLLIHNVLDVIMKKMSSRELMRARLTCKLWEESATKVLQKRSNMFINFSGLKGRYSWRLNEFLNILQTLKERNTFRNFSFNCFDDLIYFMNYVFIMNKGQNGGKPRIIEGIHLENVKRFDLNTLVIFLSALSPNLKSLSILHSGYQAESFCNLHSILPIQIELPKLEKLEFERLFTPFLLLGKILAFPRPSLKYLKLGVVINSNQEESDLQFQVLKDSLKSMDLTLITEFQLSICINDSRHDFEKYLRFFEETGLKVTTLKLNFVHKTQPNSNLTILFREFSRFHNFLHHYSETLQNLELCLKSQGLLTNTELPLIHRAAGIIPFDLLPVMPNLKKLKYDIWVSLKDRCLIIPVVPLNLQVICPKIKFFQTRKKNFQPISPVNPEFQKQFYSWTI